MSWPLHTYLFKARAPDLNLNANIKSQSWPHEIVFTGHDLTSPHVPLFKACVPGLNLNTNMKSRSWPWFSLLVWLSVVCCVYHLPKFSVLEWQSDGVFIVYESNGLTTRRANSIEHIDNKMAGSTYRRKQALTWLQWYGPWIISL